MNRPLWHTFWWTLSPPTYWLSLRFFPLSRCKNFPKRDSAVKLYTLRSSFCPFLQNLLICVQWMSWLMNDNTSKKIFFLCNLSFAEEKFDNVVNLKVLWWDHGGRSKMAKVGQGQPEKTLRGRGSGGRLTWIEKKVGKKERKKKVGAGKLAQRNQRTATKRVWADIAINKNSEICTGCPIENSNQN